MRTVGALITPTPRSMILALTAALLTLPTPASAQRLGVVTAVEGTAMVTRATTPRPEPLKFKDEILGRDRITTDTASRIRILLGGVAVVTIREHSDVIVTPPATVELPKGQIALAVAPDTRGCPEITTPNAVVRVCGTLVIAEISQTGAQIRPCPADVTSRFTVASGVVSIAALDPATGKPIGDWVHVGPSQRITVIGCRARDRPTPGGAPALGEIDRVSSAELEALSETFRLRPPP